MTAEVPAISLDVNVLEETAASALLLTRSKTGFSINSQAEESEAVTIVQELGCLPLAIEQAAAYIREICKDISNFMPAYTDNRASLHHCVPHGNQVYPKLVATTWLLTFDIIQSRNPGAVRLLQLFALLNPDGIRFDFL